jgi:hypothetical protein
MDHQFEIVMVAPTININGDSQASMLDAHLEAMHAIDAAIEAFRKTAPHGRNYPGQADSFRFAREAYFLRLTALQEIASDLGRLAISINQQGK